MGTYFEVKPAESSKAGRHYSVANGSVIKNYGQRIVTGKNDQGAKVSLPIQAADVESMMGSAREMVDAGDRIVGQRRPREVLQLP